MECQGFRELFEDFLAGALAPAELKAVERHVRECSVCSLELAAEQLIDDVLSRQEHKGLSASFTDRVLASYRQERVRAVGSPLRALPSIGYTASAAALLYGFTRYIDGTTFSRSILTALVDTTREAVSAESTGLEWASTLFGQVGVLPVSAVACAIIAVWGIYAMLDGGQLGYERR